MDYQAIFKRYEVKFLLTVEQKKLLLQKMEPYMELDEYGRTTIRNLYYDTQNYRLIRRSIEKPVYKEKIRIRSYCAAEPTDSVFVELKKKFKGVVYKRRVSTSLENAMAWLRGSMDAPQPGQIAEEIDYFKTFYEGLHPVVFLSYEREAYYCADGSDLRVTFDDHIFCRQGCISMNSPTGGESILPDGFVLMEIKTSGAIPLWLTSVLSENRIYKTSFSKYGTAYQTLIYPTLKGKNVHA